LICHDSGKYDERTQAIAHADPHHATAALRPRSRPAVLLREWSIRARP
jgi:hypothetical protein